MSTGDQSQYMRGKVAQRGLERGAHFMEDGFDRWAESTAPARAGQMEKMGSEPMAQNYGGAMTLKHAKKLRGGFVPIPEQVQKAIDQAKQLAAMWREVSKFLTELRDELENEVIENPAAPESYKNVARQLLAALNSIQSLQSVLDAAASFVGSGSKLRGGATVVEQVSAAAQKIFQAYGWLKANKPGITGVLSLRALQPVGKQVLGFIEPIFAAVGMGKKCCGGALPVYDVNTGKMEPSRRKGGMGLLEALQQKGMMQPGYFQQGGEPMQRPRQSKEMMESMQREPMQRPRQSKEMMESMQMEPMQRPRQSKEMMTGGRRRKGESKLMDASPFAQAEAMKAITGMGRKVGGKSPSERGEIVKKVMREQGLSLPQASKYVKEQGLYSGGAFRKTGAPRQSSAFFD
jgi:hypothetical protein